MESVLNPADLKRIEAIHRGFLYQHLFAVSCLLLQPPELIAVAIERDEDVELIFPDRRVYVQVKTRAAVINRDDLEGTLNRVDLISSEHESGKRSGSAEFLILANVPFSRGATDSLNSKGIAFAFPGSTQTPMQLPGPWADLAEAVEYCERAATKIPLAGLHPRTLVWKLAAIVAFACSGDDGRTRHEISVSEMAELCEVFAQQLHFLPAPPDPYRAQEGEPPSLDEVKHLLLVVAHSGGGKTAWVAESAMHSGRPIVYFDIGLLPDSSLAPSLLREAVAQLAPKITVNPTGNLRPGALSRNPTDA